MSILLISLNENIKITLFNGNKKPIGTKKPIFLRQFLQGIEWKFGFRYEPKYELKDILYDKAWKPPMFKEIYSKIKKPSPKLLSVF